MRASLKQAAVAAMTLLAAGPLAAQTATLPQLAADKLCACVGETTQPDSAVARLQRCLPQAVAEAAAARPGSLKGMGTVEGIQGT